MHDIGVKTNIEKMVPCWIPSSTENWRLTFLATGKAVVTPIVMVRYLYTDSCSTMLCNYSFSMIALLVLTPASSILDTCYISLHMSHQKCISSSIFCTTGQQNIAHSIIIFRFMLHMNTVVYFYNGVIFKCWNNY